MMRNPKRIFVVADDLTGAADAANYFRTRTRRVRVSLNADRPWTFSLQDNIVQVFDSESRGLDESAAVHRGATAGLQLSEHLNNDFLIYKKIDSTLRGHIGSEIEALLQAVGRRVALVAPAFPANGRTVRNDTLLVDGTPLSQTVFSRDPCHQVVQDKVSSIVQHTTHLRVITLDRDIAAKGSTAISDFIKTIDDQITIVVADAANDADLASLARAIAGQSSVLPCGSAGFAKQLAALWVDTAGDAQHFESQDHTCSCDHIVIAVGSAHPAAHAQLRHAALEYNAKTLELKPSLLAKAPTRKDELLRAKDALSTLATQPIVCMTLNEERALRDPALPGRFESDLASIIHDFIEQILANHPKNIGFVVTGGDTAAALCEALSTSAIWPEGEVAAGMPWSFLETPFGKYVMISKAGGFGQLDAIQQAITFLQN